MKNISIILYKRNTSETSGILKVRVYENGKTKFISLNEKVDEKFWNDSKQTISLKCPDHDRLNKIIEKTKLDFSNILTKEVPEASEKSFLKYLEKRKKSYIFQTAKRINTVENNLKEFIKNSNRKDLLFDELTEDFLFNFRSYLQSKNLKTNTVTKYLVVIKTNLNAAIKENYYTPKRSPFLNIKLPRKSGKTPLTVTEVKQIIDFRCSGELLATKNKFLFQIFAQGSRVSDLMLQRWSNIKDERINFTTFKGKRNVSINLNNNLVLILADNILQYKYDIEGIETLIKIEQDIQEYLNEPKSTQALIPLKKLERLKHVLPESANDRIKLQSNITEDLTLKKYKLLKVEIALPLIHQLSINPKFRDQFIFSKFKPEYFKNFDINTPTKQQVKQIESATTMYNKLLKDLQKALQIPTKITSHLARHSAANLMLEMGIDVYQISKSLFHSSLQITENYLAGFLSKKVDDVNKDISDKFNI